MIPSRIKGSLYGIAVADALGSPMEFQPRGTFPEVTEMLENETFNIPAGSFTDDTSMTLCLAESLARTDRAVNALDQIRRYIQWYRCGHLSSTGDCFDVGATTRIALEIWEEHFELVGYASDGGLGKADNRSEIVKEEEEEVFVRGQKKIDDALKRKSFCGNGSLMRIAPIALAFHKAPLSTTLDHVAVVSAVTHPHPTNTEACQLYTALIVHALQGESKSVLAARLSRYLCSTGDGNETKDRNSNISRTAAGGDRSGQDFKVYDEQLLARMQCYCIEHSISTGINATAEADDLESEGAQAIRKWQDKPSDDIRSSGFVVSTLEAALWVFFTTESFESGVVKAVHLGYDTDTVAAVYAGLAGAYYGFESVPTRWIQALNGGVHVQRVTADFVQAVCHC